MSLRPGDNYRVTAVLDTAGASNHLEALPVTSPNGALYLPANDQPVPGFLGGVSPLLTVWRKLHLEFDSMTAPPANGHR